MMLFNVFFYNSDGALDLHGRQFRSEAEALCVANRYREHGYTAFVQRATIAR